MMTVEGGIDIADMKGRFGVEKLRLLSECILEVFESLLCLPLTMSKAVATL
jgi:hypothetical protein